MAPKPAFSEASLAGHEIEIYGGNRNKTGWKMIGFPGVIAVHRENIEKYKDKKFPVDPVSIAGHELREDDMATKLKDRRCRHRGPRLDGRHSFKGAHRGWIESGRARTRRHANHRQGLRGARHPRTSCAT